MPSYRDTGNQDPRELLALRRENPAWQLLASRRGPLILGCLAELFRARDASIPVEDLEVALAELFAEHASLEEYFVEDQNYRRAANRELKEWIKRKLIIEREGRIIATDELQQALRFVEGLSDRIMTSTASRLATVQQAIDNLAIRLTRDQDARADALVEQINRLETELARVRSGEFDVLSGRAAEEAIREIYDLATSLRADFRRVEDSFREADRALRLLVISEDRHRGEILDSLLDTHDALRQTPEGMTFAGFHEQLSQSLPLDKMNRQLKAIIRAEDAMSALSDDQRSELGLLKLTLVTEALGVIRARATSERDVKSFIKTGLAAEHHRVGQLLGEILEVSTRIDWGRQQIRRAPASLPVIGVAINNLPLVERLRVKAPEVAASSLLSFERREASLDDLEDDFWLSLDALDRKALYEQTRSVVDELARPVAIGELAVALAPEHDLEAIAYWIALAREAGEEPGEALDCFDLPRAREGVVRFRLPRVEISLSVLDKAGWDV